MKLLIACVWLFGFLTCLFYVVATFLFVFVGFRHSKHPRPWCDCRHCTNARVEANNLEYDLAHFDVQEFIRR